MGLSGLKAFILSKKYTHDVLEGVTLIEGKPCTIASVTDITGGKRITFRWTANDGTTKTTTLDVMNGEKGNKGDKGDTGNTGADGATGAPGTAATIRVGAVTSGDSPSVENVGTSTEAIFNFTLAKGDKGDKGDTGEDGQDGKSFEIKASYATYADLIAAHPTGEAGDAYFVGTGTSPDLYTWLTDDQSWYNNGPIAGVKGDKGDTGDDGYSPTATVTKNSQTGVVTITIQDKNGTTTETVEDGADGAAGADGKSAYEIAVEEGFVGTKAEWLASLKGDDGEDGAPGENGTDGVSPVANITEENGIYTIHIEDATGVTEEEIDMSKYVFLTHNIPRANPKDITAYYADGTLWKRLNGTDGFEFCEDIYVGDYIKMSRAISAYERTGQYQETGSDYVTIAGIDTLMGNGDTAVDYHHLVMVPGKGFGGTQHFGRSRMNSSNSTTGGYVGSEMHTTTIGAVASSGSTAANATINQQLYAEFGSHLKTTKELLSNSMNASGYNKFGTNSGCSNNWAWTSCQAVLMSEVECYGAAICSSSLYDTGNAAAQLPLFVHSKEARNNRSAYYWLKDVASATYFCLCGNYGYAHSSYAGGASLYVRPRFVIAA